MTSVITSAQERKIYWRVVLRCLMEFHQLSSSDARQLSKSLKLKIDRLPPRASEFFYHNEALEIAHELAGSNREDSETQKRYVSIWKQEVRAVRDSSKLTVRARAIRK